MELIDDTLIEHGLDPKLPLEVIELVFCFLSPPHTSHPFPPQFCFINSHLYPKLFQLLYKHVIIGSSLKSSRFSFIINTISSRSEMVKHLSLFLPLEESNSSTLDLLQFHNLKTLSLESESTSTSRENWKKNFDSNRTDPFPQRFPPSLRSLTLGPDSFHWYSTTARKDLIFQSQPLPLPFEATSPTNSDSFNYRTWSFGRSEAEETDFKGKGLKLFHLHLYSPAMNSRVLTRLRTCDCFPHVESLTLSLPKVAHPDDLRLLKRTLQHLTDDHDSSWVYGSKRTFSRGLKRITVRIWEGWIDHVRNHLGLKDQECEEDLEIYDYEKLDFQEMIEREIKMRELDSETRFRKAVKVERFEVEAGKWRNARDEEFKKGGWIGDLREWD